MTITNLKHSGKCNGNLAIDISQLFSISTPSISITPDQISGGVLEIKEKDSGGAVEFSCVKCHEEIGTDPKQISAKCVVCGKTKPSFDIWVSQQFSLLCTSCRDALSGDGESASKEVQEILTYFLLPKSGIRFVSLAELLSKPISL